MHRRHGDDITRCELERVSVVSTLGDKHGQTKMSIIFSCFSGNCVLCMSRTLTELYIRTYLHSSGLGV